MAISDKLNYLIETKQLFKDRLNSLGAEITSSTTFRDYLTWLDTFYNNVSDKTDLSANGIKGRTSQDALLPSEYTQVDYIQSSGTQYIDTGVNADNKLDIKYTLGNQNSLNTGAIYDNSGTYSRYHIGSNNSKYSFFILQNATLSTIAIDNLKHDFYIKTSNREVLVDNVSYQLPTATSTDTGLNFWLFRRNSNNANLRSYGIFNLYYCKMYYNNVLVRDFIPCYRNSDNEVGLYDIVNDAFYTNQGTGDFTYGSVASIPNPDYPQPINNLSGNVAYKVSGKNKFNINETPSIIQYNTYSITNNKITFTNTASTSNPFSGIEIPIKLKNNTQYTISFKVGKNSSISSMERTIYIVKKQATNNFGTPPEFMCSGLSANTSSENKTLTFTTTQEDYFIRLYAGTNTESIANPNYYENIQINEGSTVNSYEPYIEPQTFNIPLEDIELCKIDTYEDKIYSSNGRFYLYKVEDKAILNGSEYWIKNNTYPNVYYVDNFFTDIVQDADRLMLCNYFTYGGKISSSASVQIGKFYTWTSLLNRFIIGTDLFLSTDNLKNWLSTHNTIVYYPLATPTTTEITQENYPALYNALKQIQDYLTAYKINKEFILGYSSPEIEY